MQYAHRVDGMQRAGDLNQEAQRCVLGDRRFHPLAQIAGGKVFHGDVGMIVRHAQIVNAHDVLVVQARDDFIFRRNRSKLTTRSETSGTWLNTLSTTTVPARSLSAR